MNQNVVRFFEPVEDISGFLKGPDPEDHMNVSPFVQINRNFCDRAHHLALISEQSRLTYAELGLLVAEYRSRLSAAGVSARSRVATIMPACIEAVAVILALHSIRASYVPLEAAQSPERMSEIAANLFVKLAVTINGTIAIDRVPGLRMIELDDIAEAMRRAKGRRQAEHNDHQNAPDADDEAYLIHTSGSSGVPKGVRVLHRNLAAMNAARRMVYPGAWRFLLVSPLPFDSSVAGLFSTLSAGGALVVASDDQILDPAALVETIACEKVEVVLCVPSLYQAMLDSVTDLRVESSLRCIILAGEPVGHALLARHFEGPFRKASLVNEYGPTETTVWASYAELHEGEDIRIGRPAPGVGLAILGDKGEVDQAAVEGELIISGLGVSAGYVGVSDRDAEARFSLVGGIRYYRTGDRVRRVGSEFEFLGRLDQKVKVRGQWVDLAQLEKFVRDTPGIANACAIFERDTGEVFLFVESRSKPSTEELRREILTNLGPNSMPRQIEILETMPLAATGKLDRQALENRVASIGDSSSVAQGHPKEADISEFPRVALSDDATEEDILAVVASAWSMLLESEDLPHDTSFFEQGGHSLLIFRLRDLLERAIGVRVAAVDLFNAVTIDQQTSLLSRALRVENSQPANEKSYASAAGSRRLRTQRIRRAGNSRPGTGINP